MGKGGLTRTSAKTCMSHPLVALNFKGTEMKGYRGKNMEVIRRWSISKDFERRMGDLVNI